MKVALKSKAAGPKGVFNHGDVISLPDDEAKALIASGQAEPVKDMLARKKAEKDAKTAIASTGSTE